MKSTILFICLLVCQIFFAQSYNPSLPLKAYAGETILTSQVKAEKNKAVLRGTEATKNSAFVLQHYNGIQPSVYPGYDGGFWPKKQPKRLRKINFDTRQLDELVNWGKRNNLHIIHHCLFFPNKYFPKWFWDSQYSKKELEYLLKKYIQTVLNNNQNKDKIDAFNLINEIFAMNNTGKYRVNGNGKEDCKWMAMGFENDASGLEGKAKINDQHPIFVRKVFEQAAMLTKAKLEIRDFNIAFGGKKADAIYQLVKHLKNTGVKIDAVGFQCHLYANRKYDYEKLYNNIKKFKALGLAVYITELDVGLNLWTPKGPKKKVSSVLKTKTDWQHYFDQQNKVYYHTIKTARAAGIDLISDWGFRDDLPYGNWRKGQKAWLVNKDYSKKSAYFAFLKGLYDSQ